MSNRQVYKYDKVAQEVVTAEEYDRRYPEEKTAGMVVIGELKEEVRSPIDGKVITNRRELRNHNKTHGVVDRREMQGHRFEKPALPSAASEVARAFKEHTGKF